MSSTPSTADTQTSADSPTLPTETASIGRFVALFTPVFAVAAGWLAGVVARAVPGAHLDQPQIVAFMTAAAVSAIAAGWKWLQGWQQHEALVAQGRARPVKAGTPIPAPAVAPVVAQAPTLVLTPPAVPVSSAVPAPNGAPQAG